MSPEDVGKALQLRHETRLTVKEPIVMENVIPLLGDGGQEPYKEPIRLNFDDEIEPGKRRMHSGASGPTAWTGDRCGDCNGGYGGTSKGA